MRTYRTEILVPSDRSVVLQLPDHVPAGWATVTIRVDEPDPADFEEVLDLDHTDIEWWEEFEDEQSPAALEPELSPAVG